MAMRAELRPENRIQTKTCNHYLGRNNQFLHDLGFFQGKENEEMFQLLCWLPDLSNTKEAFCTIIIQKNFYSSASTFQLCLSNSSVSLQLPSEEWGEAIQQMNSGNHEESKHEYGSGICVHVLQMMKGIKTQASRGASSLWHY